MRQVFPDADIPPDLPGLPFEPAAAGEDRSKAMLDLDDFAQR
jgi:hypothetical protein